jgi:hypothetical protein
MQKAFRCEKGANVGIRPGMASFEWSRGKNFRFALYGQALDDAI